MNGPIEAWKATPSLATVDDLQSLHPPLPTMERVSPWSDGELTLTKVFAVLMRHKLAALIWLSLAMTLAGLLILNLMPWYRANALLALDSRQLEFTDVNAIGTRVGNTLDPNFVRTQVGIISSDEIALRVIGDLGLEKLAEFSRPAPKRQQLAGMLVPMFGWWPPAADFLRTMALPPEPLTPEQRRNATLETYRHDLQVSNDGRSYIIGLSFSSQDPKLAKAIANRHAEAFIASSREAKNRSLDAATTWLNREVTRLAERLAQAELAVQTYRDQHHPLSSKVEPVLQQQLTNATEHLGLAESDLAQLAVGQDGQAEETSGLDVLRRHRDEMQRTVKSLGDSLAALQRDQLGMQQLEREASAQRALYESLLARQKLIETQVGIQQADAYVVSLAELPDAPYFPDRRLFFSVAFILAAASATAFCFMLDRRRRGFVSLDEVQNSLGLRQLAAIPCIEGRAVRAPLALAGVVAAHPRSAAAESLRMLRNIVAFHGRNTNRVIAVASYLPGEGRTSVALALARSLSVSGQRVLLIEGDLHRRTLAKLCGTNPARNGVVAVLTGAAPLAATVIADDVLGLDLLLAETAVDNPQNLLLPACFRRLIASAQDVYDYVIVDTPPISTASDALLIAGSVQTTILVIGAGKTPSGDVGRAAQEFRSSNFPLLGAVLNRASRSTNKVGVRG